MKRLNVLLLGILVAIAFSGCATIITHKADPKKPSSHGIRVFPSRAYLVVTDEGSTIQFLPDYTQAYDIKPFTLLAKNDVVIELQNGQIMKVDSKEDSTAFIEFLNKLVDTAAEVLPAAMGVSAEEINANLGLPLGIYRLDDNGIFQPAVNLPTVVR